MTQRLASRDVGRNNAGWIHFPRQEHKFPRIGIPLSVAGKLSCPTAVVYAPGLLVRHFPCSELQLIDGNIGISRQQRDSGQILHAALYILRSKAPKWPILCLTLQRLHTAYQYCNDRNKHTRRNEPYIPTIHLLLFLRFAVTC